MGYKPIKKKDLEDLRLAPVRRWPRFGRLQWKDSAGKRIASFVRERRVAIATRRLRRDVIQENSPVPII